jgi:hypothetical protein
VERCMRREFMRVSTASVRLPNVECWALLEPASVVSAETANRAQILSLRDQGKVAADRDVPDFALPIVGPRFPARLMNLGGGGLGLIVDRADAAGVDRAKILWMRVDLRPFVPAPMGITGKIAHTHIDSTQSVYTGVAFEFAFNPSHRDFVVAEVQKYIACLQAKRTAA